MILCEFRIGTVSLVSIKINPPAAFFVIVLLTTLDGKPRCLPRYRRNLCEQYRCLKVRQFSSSSVERSCNMIFPKDRLLRPLGKGRLNLWFLMY